MEILRCINNSEARLRLRAWTTGEELISQTTEAALHITDEEEEAALEDGGSHRPPGPLPNIKLLFIPIISVATTTQLQLELRSIVQTERFNVPPEDEENTQMT